MKKLFLIVSIIAMAHFSNDVSAKAKLKLQPMPPASCATDRTFTLAGPIDSKEVHSNSVALVNESTLYLQIGGGSATATLLFGPIGMAANMVSIKKKTESQANALDKNYIVDPMKLLPQTFPVQSDGKTNVSTISVTPFVLYVRPKKSEQIERRVVLNIHCDGWHGWYSYHLRSITAEKLGVEMTNQEYEDYQAQLLNASKQLIRLFKMDAAGRTVVLENKEVTSWVLNPYFKAALPQGILGNFEGKIVVVGQGEIEKDQYIFSLMKGMHLLDSDQLEIGKDWD